MSEPVGLPPLLRGRRRGIFARLVGCALAGAGCAVLAAVLVGRLVGAPTGRIGWWALAVLVALAGLGLSRYAERVLAERLGQDYVHEVRLRLARIALRGEERTALGITLARVTNDLSSLRGWIAQGIAPLVAAVPLVAGAVLVLGWLHWQLALAVLIPLAVLALVLWGISLQAYDRARTLRRRRGRMASRLGDTVRARESILLAGGEDREMRRLAEDSAKVQQAAVARARTAGVLQAVALSTAAAMAGLIALVGRTAGVEPGVIATGLTLAGVLAAPLGETGRMVEFRQNFRAARRILGPHLARNPEHPEHPEAAATNPRRVRRQVASGRGLVRAEGTGADGTPWAVTARAGDRIRLVGADPDRLADLLREIAAPDRAGETRVVIDGWDHAGADPRRRRELVGLAAADQPLERGTIARAVRYRRPDLPASTATAMLEKIGLASVVAGLPRGERTQLRAGGDPLGSTELTLLKLARAMIGEPPLLLLDRVDQALDADGRRRVAALLADYPGVVLAAGQACEEFGCTAQRTVAGPAVAGSAGRADIASPS